jgi:hypothetical protein
MSSEVKTPKSHCVMRTSWTDMVFGCLRLFDYPISNNWSVGDGQSKGGRLGITRNWDFRQPLSKSSQPKIFEHFKLRRKEPFAFLSSAFWLSFTPSLNATLSPSFTLLLSSTLSQPLAVLDSVKPPIGPIRCPRTIRILLKRFALPPPNFSHPTIYWSHLPYPRGQNALNLPNLFPGIYCQAYGQGFAKLAKDTPPIKLHWGEEGSSSVQGSVSVRVWS